MNSDLEAPASQETPPERTGLEFYDSVGMFFDVFDYCGDLVRQFRSQFPCLAAGFIQLAPESISDNVANSERARR